METLHQQYRDRGVHVLIIDVREKESIAQGWAAGHGFSFPVLLDADGSVSERYAPEGVLPDLPRYQIPIGSNLIIDRSGHIQFYTLLDTKNFDARLVALRKKLLSLFEAEESDSSSGDLIGTRVVSLDSVQSVMLEKGNAVTITIPISIKEGYHILADAGGQEYLIPLRIALNSGKGITVGEPEYPPGEPFALLGSKNPFGVYSGEVKTGVPVSAHSAAKTGRRTLEGRIVYQSCNENTCFPPDSLKVSIPIEIIDAGDE